MYPARAFRASDRAGWLFGCYNPPFFNGDVQIQTWELG
jgi:hypothetical protein